MDNFPFQGIILSSILKDRSVVGERQMDGRRSHGFILKVKGATKYYTSEGSWLLSAGEILHVAKGASYFIREVEPGYSYVVNFEYPSSAGNPIQKLRLPQGYDLSAPGDKLYHSWLKEGGIYDALAQLYSILSQTAKVQQEGYFSPRQKHLLEPVMDYLKAHLTDPDFRLEELSQQAGICEVYLRRIFRKQYGAAPGVYVIQERIRLAKHLLENGNDPINQVAAAVGYRDPLYFSRLFKKQVGLSPSQYSQQYAKDLF